MREGDVLFDMLLLIDEIMQNQLQLLYSYLILHQTLSSKNQIVYEKRLNILLQHTRVVITQ